MTAVIAITSGSAGTGKSILNAIRRLPGTCVLTPGMRPKHHHPTRPALISMPLSTATRIIRQMIGKQFKFLSKDSQPTPC